MDVSPEFWSGKRVFLTGHTGFKGSWLALWLQRLGAELTGYALAPPTQPSLFEVARVGQGMRSVIADIRDLAELADAVAQARPQIVIHMAAQPLVRHSYNHPVETYATNVMGTVHLLEAIRFAPDVRVAINVTTDKCYENHGRPEGYREGEPLGGYDPYSNSKACSELVTAAYRSSFFNPADYARHGVGLASARAGNVIGGGDWAQDRLIPDVIQAFIAHRPAVIRNPHATRPWQHVLEPLSGYLLLAERLWHAGPAHAEAWNFGPDPADAQPVEAIVRTLAARWGSGAHWEVDARTHPHEAHELRLDIGKARSKLGWQPRWTLDTALDHIVHWVRAHQSGADMRELTLAQIDAYTAASLQ